MSEAINACVYVGDLPQGTDWVVIQGRQDIEWMVDHLDCQEIAVADDIGCLLVQYLPDGEFGQIWYCESFTPHNHKLAWSLSG